MHKYVSALLLFFFFSIAITQPTALGAPPKSKTTDTPSPSLNPSTAKANLLKLARTIERKTSQLRGLHLKRPIPMGVMDQKEILAFVENKLDKDYTDEEIRTDEAILKLLGLIPQNIGYKETVLALLQEQIAGFYDPLQHKLNLADWLPPALQEPALSHEICHGLQDQYFQLKNFITPIRDNADRQLALAALVEGDCTGVMLEYMLAPLGRDLGSMGEKLGQLMNSGLLTSLGSSKLKSTPSFIRETLLFPYTYGISFIQKVRAKSPWSEINKMYRKLPDSTEQVMHPEKYWSRERPIFLKYKPLPSLRDYQKVKQDVLGEFQLALYLGQTLESSIAKRAAEGWGGDLLLAYRPKDASSPLFLIHLTAWDSEADALEFFHGQRHVFERKKLTALDSETKDLWIYQDKEGKEWSVQISKQYVLSLIAVPAETRALLQQEIWDSWKLPGYKGKSKKK